MEPTRQGGERRTRADWKQLVAEWKRSGSTAERFASGHGLSAKSLRWWSWHLRATEATGTGPTTGGGLVPVRIVEGTAELRPPAHCGSSLAWRLRTPRGELRVYAPQSDAGFLAAVAALLEGGS